MSHERQKRALHLTLRNSPWEAEASQLASTPSLRLSQCQSVPWRITKEAAKNRAAFSASSPNTSKSLMLVCDSPEPCSTFPHSCGPTSKTQRNTQTYKFRLRRTKVIHILNSTNIDSWPNIPDQHKLKLEPNHKPHQVTIHSSKTDLNQSQVKTQSHNTFPNSQIRLRFQKSTSQENHFHNL